MSESPSVRVSECPSVRVSECPSVRVSECPSVRVSESPSVRVSECPSLRVSECPSLRVSESPSLRVSESPSPTSSSLRVSESHVFESHVPDVRGHRRVNNLTLCVLGKEKSGRAVGLQLGCGKLKSFNNDANSVMFSRLNNDSKLIPS